MATTVYRSSNPGLSLLVLILLAIVAFESYYIWTGHWPSWSTNLTSRFSAPVHKNTNNPESSNSAPSTLSPAGSAVNNANNSYSFDDKMERFKERMNQFFTEASNEMHGFSAPNGFEILAAPDLGLREEKDRYTLRMDIPGADKSSVNVNVDGRLLTISGTREKNVEENQSGVVRRETESGSFLRSIELPPLADSTKVQAKFDNGVLLVTIPKQAQPSTGTQVQVQ